MSISTSLPSKRFALPRTIPTAEDTWNPLIQKAIGATACEAINAALIYKPLIYNLDVEADGALETLIKHLKSLHIEWYRKQSLNASDPLWKTLEDTQSGLQALIHSSCPEKILYPQIMKATPQLGDAIVETENLYIKEDKTNAKQNANKLITHYVQPLYETLELVRCPNTFAQIDRTTILKQIEELVAQLEEIANHQRSPINQVAHLVTRSVNQLWESYTQPPTKPKEKKRQQHPLMHLLAVIQKTAQEKISLTGDSKKEVFDTLHDLDVLSPFFSGVYKFVTSRIKDPHTQPTRLRELMTQFITLRSQVEINAQTIQTTHKLLKDVYQNFCQEKPDWENDDAQIIWAKKLLSSDLTPYLETDQEGLLNRAGVALVASALLERRIFAIYLRANPMEIELPPKDGVIDWGLQLLSNEHPPEALRPWIEQMKETQANQRFFENIASRATALKQSYITHLSLQYSKQFIDNHQKIVGEADKEVEATRNNQISNAFQAVTGGETNEDKISKINAKTKEKIENSRNEIKKKFENEKNRVERSPLWNKMNAEWAKQLVRGEKTGLPQREGFPDATLMREQIIWQALAIGQQLEECDLIEAKMKIFVERNKQLTGPEWVEAFNDSIHYLEIMDTLFSGEEKREKVEKMQAWVLELMDKVKVKIKESLPSFRHQEIDEAFNQAVTWMRQGNTTAGIAHIEALACSDQGKALWQKIPSPIKELTPYFDTFCSSRPPENRPKCHAEVRAILNNSTESWNDNFIIAAIEKQLDQLFNNALIFGIYQVVAYFLKIESSAEAYKKVRHACSEIKKYPTHDSIAKEISSLLNKEPAITKEDPIVSSFAKNMETARDGGAFDKDIYLAILDLLINNSALPWYNPRRLFIRAFFTPLYETAEFLMTPYKNSLKEEIALLLSEPTTQEEPEEKRSTKERKSYTELFGMVITALTKGLSTYNSALKDQEELYKNQRENLKAFNSGKEILDGTSSDIPKILNSTPSSLAGFKKSQITKKMSYSLAAVFGVPNYCNAINRLMDAIKTYNVTYFSSETLNKGLQLIKSVAMVAPLLLLGALSVGVKVIILSINFFIHSGVRLYLWRHDVIGDALKEEIDSSFSQVSASSPVATLLYDLLKNFNHEAQSKGKQTHHRLQMTAADEALKKKIAEGLTHLTETVELLGYETPSSRSKATKEGLNSFHYQAVYRPLTDTIASLLLQTSHTLLEKKGLRESLFTALQMGNEALEGGKKFVLSKEQKEELAKIKGKEVSMLTEEEMTKRGEELALNAVAEIPKEWENLRKNTIEPVIKMGAENLLSTPSHFLSNYIQWIDTQLLSHGESNIIATLITKLKSASQKQHEEQRAALLEIYDLFAEFIMQLKWHQSKVDADSSVVNQALNFFINRHLSSHLIAITEKLNQCKQDISKIPECIDYLETFDHYTAPMSRELRKVKEMHLQQRKEEGVPGRLKEKYEQGIGYFQELLERSTNSIVTYKTTSELDNARTSLNNPILISHLLHWLMLLYNSPETAR